MQEYDPARLQVLLVDDNRNFLATLKLMLRTLGFRRIFEATDPGQALSILHGAEIDVALIDLKLGASDGLELVRMIRTEYEFHHLPIVIVTAYAERAYVEAAIEAGANQFLAKPLSAATLYTHLISAIEGFRPSSYPI